MKFKYCENCRKAYVRSRLEGDKCIYCNQPCETVDVKRNGLYYAGYLVMISGATISLAPRLTPLSGSIFYLVMGIAMLIGGAALVMMGSARMARAAAVEAIGENNPGSSESDSE